MKTTKLAWILMVATALAPLAWARPASAQESKAVKKVEDTARAAMQDYDLLEFESARKQLNDALLQVKKSKLEATPAAARVHLNLAIVYAGGLQDADTAMVEMVNALQIDPTIKLDPAYRTPELQKLYDQALATVNAARSTEGDPAGVVGLQHTPVDESTIGQPIKVSVTVGAEVKAKQVVMFYRPQGQADYAQAVLSGDGVKFAGEIPGTATQGRNVQYYLEARNAAGKVAAGSGNPGSPHIVALVKAGQEGGGGDIDNEDPLAEIQNGGGDSVASGGGETPGDTTISKPAKKRGPTAIFVNVQLGTGAAYVTGTLESSPDSKVTPGFAPTPFHIMPEAGIWITPELAVSAYALLGFPFGATTFGHATFSPAAAVRASYKVAPALGIAVHGDVGFGVLRQVVSVASANPDLNGQKDTHASGPLLVGGGASYVRSIGGPLRVTADVNVLAGVPVIDKLGNSNPEFGLNIDGSLGIGFVF